MSINFLCNRCGKKLKASPEDAGKRTRCAGCGEVISIPRPSQVASSAIQAAPPKPAPQSAAAKSSAQVPEPARTSVASNLRKVLFFGLLGAVGCLVGWLAGELYLAILLPRTNEAGSLASKPTAPQLAAKGVPAPPLPEIPVGLTLAKLPPAEPPPPPAVPVTAVAPSTPAPPAPTLPDPKTAAPAPPPPEFAQRLDKAGGQSGDVQITLIWSNRNDLDLHCIDPKGEHIFYAKPRSRSGGFLDVDMNGKPPFTPQPVENIFWPKGKSPAGKYKVMVHHFANHGDPDPTEYKVSVLAGGVRKEYTGKLSAIDPIKAICEFDGAPATGVPQLQLAASPLVSVEQGARNRLKVRLAGPAGGEPIRIQLEGDLAGISITDSMLKGNGTEESIEIAVDATAVAGDRTLTIRAMSGNLRTETTFVLRVKPMLAALRMTASPELTIPQGGKNHLKIRIARANFTGPVRCEIAGDVRGLVAGTLTIAEKESEGELEIAAAGVAEVGARKLTVKASHAALTSEANFDLTIKGMPADLRLAASGKLILYRGGDNLLRVRLARVNLAEPVRVRLEGDLRGISAKALTMAPTVDDATLEIRADNSSPIGERLLKVVAEGGKLEAQTTIGLNVKEMPAHLQLAVPGEIQVNLLGRNELPVRIARHGFKGPVQVRLEGDTAGLSPQEFVIAAERDVEEVMVAASDAAVGPRKLKLSATGDGVQAEAPLDINVLPAVSAAAAPSSHRLILIIGFWTALLALGLSLSLVMGQNWYLARPLMSPGQFAVLALGSVLAGVIAGGMGQGLYLLLTQVRAFGFLAGWMLLGGLLGRGVVWFIPNLSPWRATVAGCCGGFFGAVAFLAVSTVGDIAGRFMGAAILGFAIGLMVAWVETAFRKIWLEVVEAGQVRAVNLGSTPVLLGGDGAKCTVLVAGAPARALKFWTQGEEIFCLDVLSEKTYPVTPGYRHPLKQAEVVVCSNDKGPKVVSRPPPRPAKVKSPPAPQPARATESPKPQPQPVTPAPVEQKVPAEQQMPGVPSNQCPVCGDQVKGVPGKRRCPNCFTMY